MEQNLPIIAKKIWKIVRVIYFMLRKGISKVKLLSALTVMMKRGKLAGKEAIQNLIFHHAASSVAAGRCDYEFTCRDSPAGFNLSSWRKHYSAGFARAPPPPTEEDLVEVASPALPGFGPSPIRRQLRITDSPFPLKEFEENNNSHVDEAAEEFIMKFYKDLRQQN